MDAHRIAEARSLAYHLEVAGRLATRPELLERARDRVQAWLADGRSPWYAARWQAILAQGTDAVVRILVDPGEDATALRQASPFAGVLSPRERWRLWREVRARCEGQP